MFMCLCTNYSSPVWFAGFLLYKANTALRRATRSPDGFES